MSIFASDPYTIILESRSVVAISSLRREKRAANVFSNLGITTADILESAWPFRETLGVIWRVLRGKIVQRLRNMCLKTRVTGRSDRMTPKCTYWNTVEPSPTLREMTQQSWRSKCNFS